MMIKTKGQVGGKFSQTTQPTKQRKTTTTQTNQGKECYQMNNRQKFVLNISSISQLKAATSCRAGRTQIDFSPNIKARSGKLIPLSLDSYQLRTIVLKELHGMWTRDDFSKVNSSPNYENELSALWLDHVKADISEILDKSFFMFRFRVQIDTKFEKLVEHLDTLETLLKIEPDNKTESNDTDNRCR